MTLHVWFFCLVAGCALFNIALSAWNIRQILRSARLNDMLFHLCLDAWKLRRAGASPFLERILLSQAEAEPQPTPPPVWWRRVLKLIASRTSA